MPNTLFILLQKLIDDCIAFLYMIVFDAQGEKTVECIFYSVYFHFISRLEELSSVGLPFIPQRIELRGENQCPGLLR